VEYILASRISRRKLQYRVKWFGYNNDPKWYPAWNLKNAPISIQDFHNQYPDASGPPKRLAEWLQAAEKEGFVDDHPDNNLPVHD
jgi:hypothetical protein